jgi:hypothetical protein
MKLRIFLAVVVAVALGAFLLGYSLSPGPYLPAEDSFDYRNHHCYPVDKSTYNPSEIWGN